MVRLSSSVEEYQVIVLQAGILTFQNHFISIIVHNFDLNIFSNECDIFKGYDSILIQIEK